jgi:hypothetical protein
MGFLHLSHWGGAGGSGEFRSMTMLWLGREHGRVSQPRRAIPCQGNAPTPQGFPSCAQGAAARKSARWLAARGFCRHRAAARQRHRAEWGRGKGLLSITSSAPPGRPYLPAPLAPRALHACAIVGHRSVPLSVPEHGAKRARMVSRPNSGGQRSLPDPGMPRLPLTRQPAGCWEARTPEGRRTWGCAKRRGHLRRRLRRTWGAAPNRAKKFS